MVTKEKAKPKIRSWGRWWLDTTNPPSLNIYIGYTYDISLDQCIYELQRQNWIRHMAEKRRITGADLINLRHAFNYLIDQGIIKGIENARC